MRKPLKNRFGARAMTKVEVTAVIVVLGLGLAAYFLLPRLTGPKNLQKNRNACISNLRMIGSVIDFYQQENDGVWPYVSKMRSFKVPGQEWPTLREVLAPSLKELEGEDKWFHCPADVRTLADDSPLRKDFPQETTYFETEGTSYAWMFGDLIGGKTLGREDFNKAAGFRFGRADHPVLQDFEPFHEGDSEGSFNILFADLQARVARETRSP